MSYRKRLLLLVWAILPVLAPAVELDVNGCRILSELPAAGIHPRVWFTADEYPEMRERLEDPAWKRKFDPVKEQILNEVRNDWSPFAEMDLSNPTEAQVSEYFKAGEGRNINWGVASIIGVLNEDIELIELMAKVITNYSRILLASEAIGTDNIWKKNGFNVTVSWTLGAAGLPISFDVLYDHMSEEQRTIVTQAIYTAVQGRVPYGEGLPRGFASSNHYGYHGDLAVMLAAIEGEPGVDPEVWQEEWDGIVQVLRDYFEISLWPAGAAREDGYANLGFRGGSRGYLALARRGYNVFETQLYRDFQDYLVMEYDPFPGGRLNGGASGGPYEEVYHGYNIVGHYMYPEAANTNFLVRHIFGEDYERRHRWQNNLEYVALGTGWQGPSDRQEMLEAVGLPLSVYYPTRGKFIARTGFDADALYFTFDARPDAHLIGHDKADRGNFSMSALGRVWADSRDQGAWKLSRENSLVHIDGLGQGYKAPSVRPLWHGDTGEVAGGSADLKYAYDWRWTPPWPRPWETFGPPWEPEMNGVLDLGWEEEYAHPDLAPEVLYRSEIGYAASNPWGWANLWHELHRQPYNPVEKAVRTAFLVRGTEGETRPYVIIFDDIRKDGASHLYEWILQLPLDLEVVSEGNNEVILGQPESNKRMLVRFLQPESCLLTVEDYTSSLKSDKMGKRLIASLESVEPEFQVLLFPHLEGDTLPVAGRDPESGKLTIQNGEEVQVFDTGNLPAAAGIEIPMWGPFTIIESDGQELVDTGDWMGWLDVSHRESGWVYSYALDSWLWFPSPPDENSPGEWVFILA